MRSRPRPGCGVGVCVCVCSSGKGSCDHCCKPLANLMKERAGFKLTGSKDLLESERAVEIQKSIDDEFREVAGKVLSLVHDFKEYECEQHEQSISGSEAALKTQVTELYESTEISTEVRDERVAAAIEKFQKLAEKRLEEHENERRDKIGRASCRERV